MNETFHELNCLKAIYFVARVVSHDQVLVYDETFIIIGNICP